MPITFGAVGDIISVCLLVKDLVDALDEARGSKAEYRSVVRELWILDRALLEIDLLTRTHGNGATPELRGLCETAQRAATKCKALVAEFLGRVKKYKSSFEDGQCPGMVKKVVMGVRWRVGERSGRAISCGNRRHKLGLADAIGNSQCVRHAITSYEALLR
jgi:hypothetical protein